MYTFTAPCFQEEEEEEERTRIQYVWQRRVRWPARGLNKHIGLSYFLHLHFLKENGVMFKAVICFSFFEQADAALCVYCVYAKKSLDIADWAEKEEEELLYVGMHHVNLAAVGRRLINRFRLSAIAGVVFFVVACSATV